MRAAGVSIGELVGVLREARRAASSMRPLVVDGVLARELARILGAGGDPAAVQVGSDPRQAAVYVLGKRPDRPDQYIYAFGCNQASYVCDAKYRGEGLGLTLGDQSVRDPVRQFEDPGRWDSLLFGKPPHDRTRRDEERVWCENSPEEITNGFEFNPVVVQGSQAGT